jgi:hypothetical protein
MNKNMLEELALSTITVFFFFALYYLYLFRCFRDTCCFQLQGNKLYGVKIRPLDGKSEHPKQSATKCHKAFVLCGCINPNAFHVSVSPEMILHSISSSGKNATVDHHLNNTSHENLETYTFNNWSQLNKEENITYKLQTMQMKGTFLWMNTSNIDFHYTYVILVCRASLLKPYNVKAILSIPVNPEKSPTASSD